MLSAGRQMACKSCFSRFVRQAPLIAKRISVATNAAPDRTDDQAKPYVIPKRHEIMRTLLRGRVCTNPPVTFPPASGSVAQRRFNATTGRNMGSITSLNFVQPSIRRKPVIRQALSLREATEQPKVRVAAAIARRDALSRPGDLLCMTASASQYKGTNRLLWRAIGFGRWPGGSAQL